MADQLEIAVGQVWTDADPRASGRKFRITEVEEDRARGVIVSVERNVSEHMVGRRTRWISLKRLRSQGHRGYRLVENPVTGTRVAG